MRKRIISPDGHGDRAADGEWLDLESVATVEVTSEDAAHPIDDALREGHGPGWKAGTPGPQTVRLVFDAPRRLRRIDVEIEDTRSERTQELALAWTNAAGLRQELRRQRWNFSPSGSTHEHEDYRVDLADAAAVEIVIEPDVANPQAFASIRRLRLA